MDNSGAAYATDQLGGAWISSDQERRSRGRISHPPRSTQSISSLLGRDLAFGIGSSSRSNDSVESFSSAAAQRSIRVVEDNDYLENLINDNEIQQIRSENEHVLSRLLSFYVFEDGARVRSFLEDHPSTPDLLLEAVPFLKGSFGDRAILQLQIPPDEELPLTIYAVALCEGTLEDARLALNKFDESWWAVNGHRALGKIVVDYQLV